MADLKRMFWIALSAGLLATPSSGQEDDRPMAEAATLIRVMCDTESLPLREDVLDTLLHSPSVVLAAAREVLGDNSRPADARLVEIGFEVFGDGKVFGPRTSLVAKLSVFFPADPRDDTIGERLLALIADKLRQALREATSADEELLQRRLKSVLDRVALAEKRFQDAQALVRQLREASGRADLSHERVLDEIRELEGVRRDLETDLVGVKGREEAIAAQIARISETMKSARQSDPVIGDFEQVVRVRQEEFDMTRKLHEAGQCSAADVNRATEQLAMARAQLADRQHQAMEAQGGALLGNLNHMLVDLTIEAAETEARLKHATERMARIHEVGLLDLADRYENEAGLRIELSREALVEATQLRDEIEQRLVSYELADVTVIGAK